MRWAVAGFCWYPFGCWELPLLPPLMLCQYSVRRLLYIPHRAINRTGRKNFYIEQMLSHIAGHLHQGRCRRHQHSGILYLSPVPEHSGTGLGPRGIGLVPVSAFLFIPVPDWQDAGKSNILAFKKGIHPARLYYWRCKERHPACPYFWLWKVIHPARPFCWLRKWIHCTSVLFILERDTPCTFIVHTASCGNCYLLHIPIAGVGKGYILPSILLLLKWNTPCMSILLAAEMDTYTISNQIKLLFQLKNLWNQKDSPAQCLDDDNT